MLGVYICCGINLFFQKHESPFIYVKLLNKLFFKHFGASKLKFKQIFTELLNLMSCMSLFSLCVVSVVYCLPMSYVIYFNR